jgi:signal transduction histidine kinase
MLTDKTWLRTAGPIIVVALVLLGACIAAAVYLLHEQARSAKVLRENLNSRRVANEIETTVEDLLALLRSGSTQVDALSGRIRTLLAEANRIADKEEESRLVDQVRESFEDYDQRWHENQGKGQAATGNGAKAATQTLNSRVLPTCRKLRAYNAQQIELSEEVHGQTVKWMAWGLIGGGVVNALAGSFLGYGLARGLRRSIHQLSIRIRDATDRLGQQLPTVTLAPDSHFPQLDDQLQRLVQDIEKVVQQLQQREHELLRAEQLKAVGQLAAGAAHELRNPLTAIKMLVQTILEEAAERGLPVEDLAIIEGELRRMERCLHTFLDFARPPKPERRPFDLACVVEKAFPLLETRARRQGVTLHFAPPNKPFEVEADPEQIQQVLVNLMLNALDAMPGGGRLDVELSSAKDGHVVLRVQDTGPGISPEVMPRLFEPFVSTKETGLGLGLVVSRRIAEAHGGSLRAASRSKGGACLEVRLPITRVVAPLAASGQVIR